MRQLVPTYRPDGLAPARGARPGSRRVHARAVRWRRSCSTIR